MNTKLLLYFILSFIFNSSLFTQSLDLVLKNKNASVSKYISFSNDKRFIVSADEDKTVKIWDIKKQIISKELTGHTDIVTFAEFIENDNYIVSAALDGSVRIWSSDSSGYSRTLEINEVGLKSAALTKDNSYLIGLGIDNKVVVWDIRSGWKSESFGYNENSDYKNIKVSQEGSLFILTSGYSNIFLFDLHSRSLKLRIDTGEKYNDAIFSPDGQQIIISGSKTLKFYDIHTDKLLTYKIDNEINLLRYLPKTNKLLSTTDDFTLHIIEPGYSETDKFLSSHNSRIHFLNISSDGFLAVTTSYDRTIKVWDVSKKKTTSSFIGNKIVISAVCSYNKGKNIISADNSGYIYFWDLETGNCTGSYKLHDSPVTSITLAPKKNYLFTSGKDNTIKLFDVYTSKILKTYSIDTGEFLCADITPDENFLLTGSTDKTVRIWDIDRETCLSSRILNTENLTSISASEDGQKIAVGDEVGNVFLLDVNNLSTIAVFKSHVGKVSALKFSHNSKKLFSGGEDRNLAEYNLENNFEKTVHDFGQGSISSISLDSRNRYLAIGSKDKTIYILDLKKTGGNTIYLENHDNNVNSVAFSDDNKYLISGGWDGVIKLWNYENSSLTATIMPIDNEDYVITTPENYYTCSKDGYKSVFFKYGEAEYPLGQYDILYNRPDRVLSRIGYSNQDIIENYSQLYKDKLNELKIDINKLNINAKLPDLYIENIQEISPINDAGNVLLKIKAEDFNSRLYRLNVSVNDVPFYGKGGLDLESRFTFTFNSYVYYDDLVLPLTDGINRIQISVLNEAGLESFRKLIEINYANPRKELKPDLYAIVIGLTNYQDSILNLRYASKDADDFAELINQKQDKYDSVIVFKLFNREATRENILKLKALLKLSDVNDEVLIYFNGQGFFDKNLDYYFGTYNINYKNPSVNGIGIKDIIYLFDKLPSRKRILLFNTCNSSEVDEDFKKFSAIFKNINCMPLPNEGYAGMGNTKACLVKGVIELQKYSSSQGFKKTIEILKNQFIKLRIETGAVVIGSSSGAVEYPLNDNGAFTYSIIDGLKYHKADLNNDKLISISELSNYVNSKISLLTDNQLKPIVKKENLDNDFIIW